MSEVDEKDEKGIERLLTVQLMYKHGLNRVRGAEAKKGGSYRPGEADEVLNLLKKALCIGEEEATKRVADLFRREREGDTTKNNEEDMEFLTDRAAMLSVYDINSEDEIRVPTDGRGRYTGFDRQGRQVTENGVIEGANLYLCCGQTRTCHPKSPFRCNRVASYPRNHETYANDRLTQADRPHCAEDGMLRNGHERETNHQTSAQDSFLSRSSRASSSRERGSIILPDVQRAHSTGSSSASRSQRYGASSCDHGYPSSSKHSFPSSYMDANDSSNDDSTAGGTQDGECGEPDFLEDDRFSHFNDFPESDNLSADVAYSSDEAAVLPEKAKCPPNASTDDDVFQDFYNGVGYDDDRNMPDDSVCAEVGESMDDNDFAFDTIASGGDTTSIEDGDEASLAEHTQNNGRRLETHTFETRTDGRDGAYRSEGVTYPGKGIPNTNTDDHIDSRDNDFSYVSARGNKDQPEDPESASREVTDDGYKTEESSPEQCAIAYESFSENERYSDDER